MRYLLVMPLIAVLAACGADGEPVRPSVSAGVSVNSNGRISTATSVSASTGNVTVGIGS
mgnify:CR=1 FL=1